MELQPVTVVLKSWEVAEVSVVFDSWNGVDHCRLTLQKLLLSSGVINSIGVIKFIIKTWKLYI